MRRMTFALRRGIAGAAVVFWAGVAPCARAALVESAATAPSVIDTWVPIWDGTVTVGRIDTTATGMFIVIR